MEGPPGKEGVLMEMRETCFRTSQCNGVKFNSICKLKTKQNLDEF